MSRHLNISKRSPGRNRKEGLVWQFLLRGRCKRAHRGTKTRKNREVPEVREIMIRLCRSKAYGDYVFVSPKSGSRFTDIKRAFRKACSIAGINGLVWHDLRAMFATRFGEAGFDAFTIAELLGHTNLQNNPAICSGYRAQQAGSGSSGYVIFRWTPFCHRGQCIAARTSGRLTNV